MPDISDDDTFRAYRDALIVLMAKRGRRDPLGSVDPADLKSELGIGERQFKELVQNLINDGLLSNRCELGKVALNQAGKFEANQIESDSTFQRDFAAAAPATVVNNVYGASNSIIQQAGHASKQTAKGDWSAADLQPVLKEIHEKLDEMGLDSQQLNEIRDQLETLERQLQARNPVKTVVRAAGDALAGALRRTGSAMGQELAQRVMDGAPPAS